MSEINLKRRRLLGTATASLAALELAFMGVSQAAE